MRGLRRATRTRDAKHLESAYTRNGVRVRKRQLLGVYDEYLAEPLAQVLISLGVERGMVVYGKDKLDLISLIAPTSENRIAMIAKEAEGFLYVVSSLGVTGTRSEIKTDLKSIVEVVRQNTDIPCAIGFGISTPEQAAKMAAISDGAIVGSAIVKIIEKYGREAAPHVGEYVRKMKEGIYFSRVRNAHLLRVP